MYIRQISVFGVVVSKIRLNFLIRCKSEKGASSKNYPYHKLSCRSHKFSTNAINGPREK